MAPLAPLLLEDLHLTRAQVGLFLPAIYLGGVVMSLPAGWLTDRFGARLTLAAGQCLTGALVAPRRARRQGCRTMLGLLFLGGLGWAVVNPATGKAILERFPARERGFAMGIKQTGLTVGGIAASLTLPAVALAHGWRARPHRGRARLPRRRRGGARLHAARSRRAPAREAASARASPSSGASSATARCLVLLAAGLALGMTQASVLAYLALFARETLGLYRGRGGRAPRARAGGRDRRAGSAGASSATASSAAAAGPA